MSWGNNCLFIVKKNTIVKFLSQAILDKAKFIIDQPLFFAVMAVINLFFYFKDFENNFFILFVYILSVITGVVVFLQKYRIVKFLDTSEPRTWFKDIKIYFFILVYIFGAIGAVMLFFYTLIP